MPLAVLNKRAKALLKKVRFSMSRDNLYHARLDLDMDLVESSTCCGVLELSNLDYDKYTERDFALLLLQVPKGRLMMYHAPETKNYLPVIAKLKKLGFRQMVPKWKNGVHGRRKEPVVSLYCYKDV